MLLIFFFFFTDNKRDVEIDFVLLNGRSLAILELIFATV